MFGIKRSIGPESIMQEHIQRLWDMSARLKALEDRFDSSLDELAKRYRRAEQSERDRKKREEKEPEAAEPVAPERHPAILELLERRKSNASYS